MIPVSVAVAFAGLLLDAHSAIPASRPDLHPQFDGFSVGRMLDDVSLCKRFGNWWCPRSQHGHRIHVQYPPRESVETRQYLSRLASHVIAQLLNDSTNDFPCLASQPVNYPVPLLFRERLL